MPKPLEHLLKTIKELPVIKQRAVSAIIGSTVADAATRPLHWIYNQDKLNELLKSKPDPEFWPTNESPFYSLPLGERSAYNDAMFVTLKCLYEFNGKVNVDLLCESVERHFGKSTEYMTAYERRKVAYDANNRNSFKGPVEGPWIQSAVLKCLENYSSGKGFPYGDLNNNENDGFCLTIPLIVLNAEKKELWDIVLPYSSILTTHANALKTFHLMSIMLSNYVIAETDPLNIMKQEAQLIYPNVLDQLNNVEKDFNETFVSVVNKNGKACGLPGSFLGAYCAMIRSNSYVDAVRLNITAGGCNCSRANIIGSCFGAKYGIDGIPIDWMKKTKDIELIIEMAIDVVSK